MADILLRPVEEHEVDHFWDLLQEYLGEDNGRVFSVPKNEDGSYEYPYFDLYFQQPTRFPFYVLQAEDIIGFVMVRELADDFYYVAEFYVRPEARRAGVGREAMECVFSTFPEKRWLISVIRQNEPALAFWLEIARGSGVPIELEIIDK
ncbi:MAG: GNAT family N-acetyltransferase [Bacteroidetes bacterium]|nr:GNAT family N-acetyltransferase [Bacteroidota bacterium]